MAAAALEALEPVPPINGFVEAQPNTLSLVASALSGSALSSFFSSTMPSSPVFSMVARLWATVSSASSTREAFR